MSTGGQLVIPQNFRQGLGHSFMTWRADKKRERGRDIVCPEVGARLSFSPLGIVHEKHRKIMFIKFIFRTFHLRLKRRIFFLN